MRGRKDKRGVECVYWGGERKRGDEGVRDQKMKSVTNLFATNHH
jgi:hypothetical protein